MPKFADMLCNHADLAHRKVRSSERLVMVREEFQKYIEIFCRCETSVYCAGSLGRGDLGKHSDLDLFLITTEREADRSHLDDLEMLAHIIVINRNLEAAPLSNDGQYLKVYSLDDLRSSLGAPQDDGENSFTARMLLLLESRCVWNDQIFSRATKDIAEHYFRDCRGKRTFRPLFLLNDLLRYWRTLCLNYEMIRDAPNRPWRKKNINLKFSRMVTVFGTVLPLIAKPMDNADAVLVLTRKSPLERFAYGLDLIGDDTLLGGFGQFLDDYERFLQWKEELGEGTLVAKALDVESRETAERFSNFIYDALSHGKIGSEYRKYLIL